MLPDKISSVLILLILFKSNKVFPVTLNTVAAKVGRGGYAHEGALNDEKVSRSNPGAATFALKMTKVTIGRQSLQS